MPEIAATQNPLEWTVSQLGLASVKGAPPPADGGAPPAVLTGPIPAVRRIGLAELRQALAAGFSDYTQSRSDVIALCVIYPLAGVLLGYLAFGHNLLSLAFPLLGGFALLGPLFATGLYEMSRRREAGMPAGWGAAWQAFRSPAIGSILGMGLILLGIFAAWLGAARLIWRATMGPGEPGAMGDFLSAVLTTPQGAALIAVGCGVGFLFAVLTLSISVVSFPLLLDRDPGVMPAIRKSLEAVRVNPVPMAVWGLIVAGLLAAGSLPVLIGLAVVLPVLGHATWHLYRTLVPPTP